VINRSRVSAPQKSKNLPSLSAKAANLALQKAFRVSHNGTLTGKFSQKSALTFTM